MSTPEPVDEQPVVPAETRGGDRLTDITATRFAPAWDTNNAEEPCADGCMDCAGDE